MTRSEYLDIVSNKIDKLPKDEYDKAMERFNKYFDEAGPGNEQAVINDLGDPAAAGDRIIRNLAIGNIDKDAGKSIKGNINALWIGILAVLACPIALPIAIVFLVMVFVIVIILVVTIVAVALAGVALILVCPIILAASTVVMVKSFPLFLVCVGAALALLGLGGVLVFGMYIALKWVLKKLVYFFGKIANKGGKEL